MDDERPIQWIAVNALSRIGYESDSAYDGRDALEKYKQSIDSGHPYDVVIVDLTVPGGMGGRETIVRLKELNPDIKAKIPVYFMPGLAASPDIF